MADFLKANSFALSKCVETCFKIFIKLEKIYVHKASFSCFLFIGKKFAQILKYFAQLCDCTNAAFRNPGLLLQLLGLT